MNLLKWPQMLRAVDHVRIGNHPGAARVAAAMAVVVAAPEHAGRDAGAVVFM